MNINLIILIFLAILIVIKKTLREKFVSIKNIYSKGSYSDSIPTYDKCISNLGSNTISSKIRVFKEDNKWLKTFDEKDNERNENKYTEIGRHISNYSDPANYPNEYDTYFDERSKVMLNSTKAYNLEDKKSLINSQLALGVLLPNLKCTDTSKQVYGTGTNKCPDNKLTLDDPEEIILEYKDKKFNKFSDRDDAIEDNYCNKNILDCDNDICNFMITDDNINS